LMTNLEQLDREATEKDIRARDPVDGSNL